MTTIGTRIFTALKGELVGKDEHGNRYYREKGGRKTSPLKFGRERRWAVYPSGNDITTVPAEWYGWLHYWYAAPPTEQPPVRRPWEIDRKPNLTGSPAAYRPSGHLLGDGKPATTQPDYEPWKPA